ncbi:hypothetical protein R3P38DRAFT_3190738 [Favolaschia claudopus]|uniref:Uncharacterized protein n=1 Tax=Favolaschia claudopus TaxID=2862362 RepID=A0AAW0BM17_9AGAR
MNAERLEDVKKFFSAQSSKETRRGIMFPTGQADWTVMSVPAHVEKSIGAAGIAFQYCFGLVPDVDGMPIDMAIFAPDNWQTGAGPPLAILHVDQECCEGHPPCMSFNKALNEGSSEALTWHGNVLAFPIDPATGMLQSLPESLDAWAVGITNQWVSSLYLSSLLNAW